MALTKNMEWIKNYSPAAYRHIASKETLSYVEIVQSKKEIPTLTVKLEGKTHYLHSMYDPLHEAGRFIQQLQGIEDYRHILFIGAGLGYHILEFMSSYPGKSFSIFEPDAEILRAFLSSFDLEACKNLQGLYLNINAEENLVQWNHFLNRTNGSFHVVVFPSYERIFHEQVHTALRQLQTAVENNRLVLNIRHVFEKKWVVNAMANMRYTLQTRNIFHVDSRVFSGKPVIIIAAGPSLSEEIENLKQIRRDRSAYLVAVGSAVNSLLHHEIIPDLACTYDPHFHNVNVFRQVIERNLPIPLVFGTTVGYTTLPDYPGPMFHMFTDKDPLSGYFLKGQDGRHIPVVRDAPSIAVIAVQLFALLGAGKIIFVGQNLAFLDGQYYASGIQYQGRPQEVTKMDEEMGQITLDVYGNMVRTNWQFNFMREQIELYISALQGPKYINTTKGGAAIKGAPFMELKEVMRTELQPNAVTVDWLEQVGGCYDQEYLMIQHGRLQESHHTFWEIVDELQRHFKQLDRAVRNRNERQVQKALFGLNTAFSEFQRNEFYRTVVKPLNQLQLEIVINEMNRINAERDLLTRGKMTLEQLGKYVYECSTVVNQLDPIYQLMQRSIVEYAAGRA